MFPTVELRWFREGAAPPEETQRWFQAIGQAELQHPRVDYYLHLANEPSLGVKFRDGRLEIKKRTARFSTMSIGPHVSGAMEGWRKWSFTLAQPGAAPESDRIERSPWLPVRKARQLLRFAITDERHFLFPGQFRPERGCEIELTSVTVGTAGWWSLGLEAYGPRSFVKNDLMAVARRLLVGVTAPALEAVDSYGYPEWLARLV